MSAKKKFGCDKCSKRFNRKDNLERHEMTHQVAVYNCTLCGFNGNKPFLRSQETPSLSEAQEEGQRACQEQQR
jgi:uncharacterized Zn-finger protein